jgi:hypothetical protein
VLSREAQGRDNTLYAATLTGHEASKSFAKPIVDLNLGLMASYVVSKSVLSPKDCPKLVTALNQVLEEYEGQLQRSEVALSNTIVELVRKRDSLRGRIVTTLGFKSKLKNGFLKIGAEIRNLQVNLKSNEYDSQGHLKKVVQSYEQATNRTISPYVGWYNFVVPELRLSIVKRELLSFQDVARKLWLDDSSLGKWLKEANCAGYKIRGIELFKRSELNKVLGETPFNGYTKLPE